MPFAAILFDCDGVLVDSEPISLEILRSMLDDLGWSLSFSECKRLFIGKSSSEEITLIEQHLGRPLDREWMTAYRLRRNQALRQQLVAIPGIFHCLKQLQQEKMPVACVSAAEGSKIQLQLEKVRLNDFFQGTIFSGTDTPRNKPYPDVYLHAADALGVDPRRCAIIEDSSTGATAGVASGATVFGYCPAHEDPQPLIDVGVHHIFHDMQQLPLMLQRKTS